MSKLVKNYRDLDVYQKAFSISLDVHRASIKFPKHEQFALTSQIRRASKGICANIAEGFAKQQASQAEFKRYLLIAIGSSTEMSVWIDYIEELSYATHEQENVWRGSYQTITRMLQGLYNKI